MTDRNEKEIKYRPVTVAGDELNKYVHDETYSKEFKDLAVKEILGQFGRGSLPQPLKELNAKVSSLGLFGAGRGVSGKQTQKDEKLDVEITQNQDQNDQKKTREPGK